MKRTKKIYYLYQGKGIVPLIRISGKYLNNYDLNIGDKIELTLSRGKITIYKITNRKEKML
jgi:hypothetical protein